MQRKRGRGALYVIFLGGEKGNSEGHFSQRVDIWVWSQHCSSLHFIEVIHLGVLSQRCLSLRFPKGRLLGLSQRWLSLRFPKHRILGLSQRFLSLCVQEEGRNLGFMSKCDLKEVAASPEEESQCCWIVGCRISLGLVLQCIMISSISIAIEVLASKIPWYYPCCTFSYMKKSYG